ncbi:RNA polymerase sigma factor [Breznakia pachnodae]|uniref:RNA polymerase sigma factor (Sigma-70 family) n=1 Tax=Breznakia pachnodae TaxID=265178 RepID=A0ABU0E419_9FIRM|nr:sigma-70 family RNA polymerase sigma factor [Breznakia pachnodae]MDQ0361648.1 RNA polymerase sigma factor (sigma-70 family) [Breznakia pachnodae]
MKQLSAITEDTVRRAQGGDTEAFSSIYKAYYNKIYFIAMQYFHNEEMAKDVVQEVFIRVHKKLKDLREPKTFNTWIQKVTYTICLNQNRRKMKIVDLGSEMTVEDFGDQKHVSTLDKMEDDRVNKIIMNSLENMSTPLRSVGMLRFYDGMQLKEIAEILNIPRGTVNSRIDKIKKVLRSDLQNNGISPKNYGIALLTPAMIHHAYEMLSEVYVVQSIPSETAIRALSVTAAAGKATSLLSYKVIAGVAVCASVVGVTVLNYSPPKEEEPIVAVEPQPVVQEQPVVEPEIETAKIEDTVFSQYWTNQPVNLEISTTNEEYDQILVNGVETTTILANGTYTVQLAKEGTIIDEKEVTIMNIDTQSPTGTFEHKGDYYILYLYDDLSQINPESIQFYRDGVQSYDYQFNVGNNTLTVPDHYTLDTFKISDYAGNTLDIQVNNKI